MILQETAHTVYSGDREIIADSFGGTYRLRDLSRGNGVRTYDMNTGTSYGSSVDFTDIDNDWNNINPQKDQYATDAHWGAEMTYDYFLDIHGRNSIDNAGFQLNNYVHYGELLQCLLGWFAYDLWRWSWWRNYSVDFYRHCWT